MPIANACELQRIDHKTGLWVTIIDCATRQPIRFTTISALLPFAKRYARAKKVPAIELRIAYVYSLTALDV